ncbi:MAG: sigma-70 family RNA polymerase sigma factor [Alistipes sp.]|nr:sigma-70 family RNA polymerase sigma factor [Alistipes sp.]
MTDLEIRDALIRGDEEVTRNFFYRTCRPLLISVIRRVFNYTVDYDECINELYLHLMEDDGRRLRQFAGRSTIYQWIKIVATRFFINRRGAVIDINSSNPLMERVGMTRGASPEAQNDARMDVESLFGSMKNERYATVLRRLIMDDAAPEDVAQEMGIKVDNLYNIKKRAIAALMRIAIGKE